MNMAADRGQVASFLEHRAAKIGATLARSACSILERSFWGKTALTFRESPGLLRDPRNWRKIDLANVAFGQGVSVTALQLPWLSHHSLMTAF